MGVVSLPVRNKCLLTKHIHIFYNHADIPWVHLMCEKYYTPELPPDRSRDVSFWWRDCLKSLPKYKPLAQCSLGSACSVLLWHDSWTQQLLKEQWPLLFPFAKQQQINTRQAWEIPDKAELFHLPLSVEAYTEFLDFSCCQLLSLCRASWTLGWFSIVTQSSMFLRHINI